ncbi:MAG: alkaline phosphatase family protein, partial [Gammaproteobacteria bacterium]|nr:alkaline phosphatase family protein [Gammaproteobacteria bacterium]
MGKADRVLVIGLDSMDQGMARKWAAEGVLPHIAKLIESSVWGAVKTPPGLVGGAVWPTFYTGTWPSRHGLYYFWRQAYPGSYDLRQIEEDDFTTPTIWESLSDAGKRVAVFDPPYTFLARNLNGIQIRDWGTHAPMTCSEHRFEKARFQANPSTLVDEINERFGPDRVGMCDHVPLHTAKDFADWRDGLVERVRTRTDMSLHYLRQEPWDLFMTVFSECHCIGHHALQLRDPEHTLYDPDFAAHIGDPVRDVYIATDEAIGRLLEAADKDTLSLVLFSHGIEANYTGSDLLDKVLERIDG